MQGVTVEEYCATNPKQMACDPKMPALKPEIRMCCMAMTPSCLACSAGVSEEEYCRMNPGEWGCPNKRPKLPPTGKNEPVAQATWRPEFQKAENMVEVTLEGGSTHRIPADMVDAFLAEVAAAERPNEVACCEALTAECLACSERMTMREFCTKNPDVSGCP
jgi:hypothetical protein